MNGKVPTLFYGLLNLCDLETSTKLQCILLGDPGNDVHAANRATSGIAQTPPCAGIPAYSVL